MIAFHTGEHQGDSSNDQQPCLYRKYFDKPPMPRFAVNLVRTVTHTESIEAVIETPTQVNIAPEKLKELWFVLVGSGCIPDCGEEQDHGIALYMCEFDLRLHGHLPTSSLSECQPSKTTSPLQPIQSNVGQATAPNKHLNAFRQVVVVTNEVEQYEIKRIVIEATGSEDISRQSADDLWWGLPKVEAQVDEFVRAEFDIEYETFDLPKHSALPFCFWHGTKELPLSAFLSGWQDLSETTSRDTEESMRVRKIVGVDPNQCYFNARRALRSLPEYSDAAYVEGFVVMQDGAIFEHGWTVKDGAIIDPTCPDDSMVYFPGLEFKGRKEIQAFMQDAWGKRFNGHPFHEAFGHGGFGSSSFFLAGKKAVHLLTSKFGVRELQVAKRVREKRSLPWPDEWV